MTLKDFKPFHAVYDRQYTQGSGPGQGQKRKDRVIVHADEVAWDGRRALAITLLDTGAVEQADTNMRTLTMVVAMDDLSLLFETGPIPGKAKDYYLCLINEKEILMSMVETENQKLLPKKIPTAEAGFGPGSWVMGAMPLEIGQKIRLEPYYSPTANPISQANYGRVVDRVTIIDGSHTKHEAWVLETPGWYGLSHPKALRLYLKDTPPYFLGTETFNHDTGESSRFVWLNRFQLLEP